MKNQGLLLPTAEELEEDEMMDLVQNGSKSELSQRLAEAGLNLEKLLVGGSGNVGELIRSAKQEMENLIKLRMLILSPKAIDTLEKMLDGNFQEKKGNPMVKAASDILDRAGFPRVISTTKPSIQYQEEERALPKLDDLIDEAGTDSDALVVVRKYRTILREIEDLRQGAKIIDVTPNIPGPSAE